MLSRTYTLLHFVELAFDGYRMTQWLPRVPKVLCMALLQLCTDFSWNVALWQTKWLLLYRGPCPNLLRGDNVLILVPSDSYSWLFQVLDPSSFPNGRSTACTSGYHYIFMIFLIYSFYQWRCMCNGFFITSPLGVDVCQRCLYKADYLQIFNACCFDCTIVGESGRRLTTPVWWR